MDLPTCPSCGQSVLDDDATDCPFCGAAMKGGSGTATKKPPAKTAPAKSSAAATSPAASGASKSSSSATSKSSAGSKSSGDDPFDFAANDTSKAQPLIPTMTPSRSFEVHCPMCETVGYLNPKFAGQLVKCCNPSCSLPVFVSPKPVEKPVEAAPPPPKPAMNWPMVIFATVIALVVVAAGAFLYIADPFGGPSDTKVAGPSAEQLAQIEAAKKARSEQQAAAKAKADTKAAAKSDPGSDPTTPDPTVAQNAARKQIDELVSQLPTLMIDLARNTAASRKPYVRRLISQSLAIVGNLTTAQEQLEQIQKAANNPNSYETVIPLVVIGWEQRRTGDRAASDQTFDLAASRLSGLPSQGQFPIATTLALATAQAAQGKYDAAHTTLDSRHGSASLEQVAAVLHATRAVGSFELTTRLPGQLVAADSTAQRWDHPLESAVALSLVARGEPAAAIGFAKSLTDLSARAEASLTIAESLLQKPSEFAANQPHLTLLKTDLAPHPAILARLQIREVEWQKDRSKELLEAAAQLLAPLTPAAESPITNTKSLMELRLSQSEPQEQLALAAAELARMQTLAGQNDQATAGFEKALQAARSIGPSLSLALAQENMVRTTSTRSLRDQLRAELELRSNDVAERKVVEFKQQVTRIAQSARVRFKTLSEVLLIAMRAGAQEFVQKELMRAAQEGDVSKQEPYQAGWIIGSLHQELLAKDAAKAAQFLNDFPPQTPALDPVREGERNLLATPHPIDGEALAATVNGLNDQAGHYDYAVLLLAARMVEQGESPAALQFLAYLKDSILQEEGLRLIAAIAARRGEQVAFWSAAKTRLNTPTALAALGAGLLEGTGPKPAPPPAATPAAKEDPAATKTAPGT